MTNRPAKRLLIIGWDAADWVIIDRLFAAGKMPKLRRVVQQGVRTNLGTLEPKLSPLLWSSIATGKTADKHGILNFVEPRPDGSGLRLSSSTTRKTKALWNILSQSGLVTNVIGWYASHPAEPIRGRVVSNMLQEGEPSSTTAAWPITPAAVHPEGLSSVVAASRQRSRDLSTELLGFLLPGYQKLAESEDRLRSLKKLMAYACSIEGAALAVMGGKGVSATGDGQSAGGHDVGGGLWDVTMVFFDAIDTMGHHFMQYAPPRMGHVSNRDHRLLGEVMDRVYEWHDESLGRLLAAAGPEVTVILLSDHGFHSDHLRPNLSELPPERRMELESSWHRPQGVLVLSGPGVRCGQAIAAANILDIAPTALALLGLPAGNDFDGRVLSEVLEQPAPDRVKSWDEIDGDSGLHPPDLRQDPFEATEAIQQLIDLGYMAALPKSVQGQIDLVKRESAFNLGVLLISRGRAAEAIPHFERLVEAQPEDPRYASCLGNCLLAAGRFADAAERASAFNSRSPDHLEIQLLQAAALGLAGKKDDAATQLRSLVLCTKGKSEFDLPLANLGYICGEFAQALRFAQSAMQRNPADQGAHTSLARIRLAMGEFEASAEHSLDALEITQANPEAHMLLGAALAWHGDLANAATSIGFALQRDSGLLDAHRYQALLLELSGDGAGAFSARERARQITATLQSPPPDPPFGPGDLAAKHGLKSL